jgi:small conductance mechanosensitive channel
MDLNAEVDNLVKVSQAWIPMIMEYGSVCCWRDHPGHWLVADQQGHAKLGGLLALRNADWRCKASSAAWRTSCSKYC